MSSQMIPVKIKKISYYHPSRSYAVILEEIDGDRNLPVLVGAYEAQSIADDAHLLRRPYQQTKPHYPDTQPAIAAQNHYKFAHHPLQRKF